MGISIRSYLTAGVACTAAGAIALTPLSLPPQHNETVLVPYSASSPVRLAALIKPEDIDAVVEQLTSTVTDVIGPYADSLTLAPFTTVAGLLNQVIDVNYTLWSALTAASSGSPELQGLFESVGNGILTALGDLGDPLQDALDVVNDSNVNGQEVLAQALTYSLTAALTAVAGIINDPTSAASYLGALQAPIGIGANLALGVNDGAADLMFPAFGLPVIGIGAGQGLATAALGGADSALGATELLATNENEVLGALVGAIRTATIQPTLAVLASANPVLNAPLVAALVATGVLTGNAMDDNGTPDDPDDDYWIDTGFPVIIGATSSALTGALGAIGADPLSPQSYAAALWSLGNGGLNVVDGGITTMTTMARISLGAAVIPVLGGAMTALPGLNTAIGAAATRILKAIGVEDEIANAPSEFATKMNAAINDVGTTVGEGLDKADDAIKDLDAQALHLTGEARGALTDALGVQPPAPARMYQQSSVPADPVVQEEITPEGDLSALQDAAQQDPQAKRESLTVESFTAMLAADSDGATALRRAPRATMRAAGELRRGVNKAGRTTAAAFTQAGKDIVDPAMRGDVEGTIRGVAKAPKTIAGGLRDAGTQLQQSVTSARQEFKKTMRGDSGGGSTSASESDKAS